MIAADLELWGPVIAGGGAALSLIIKKAFDVVLAKLKGQPTTVEDLRKQLAKQEAEQRRRDEATKALIHEALDERERRALESSTPAIQMSEPTALQLVAEFKRANDRAEASLRDPQS